MSVTLRTSDHAWQSVRAHASPSFRRGGVERGILGVFSENRIGNRHEALLVELFPPREDEVTSDETHLEFASRYIRRVHLEARQRGLAGLVAIHTHPFANEAVDFSPYDDAEEPQLAANLWDI